MTPRASDVFDVVGNYPAAEPSAPTSPGISRWQPFTAFSLIVTLILMVPALMDTLNSHSAAEQLRRHGRTTTSTQVTVTVTETGGRRGIASITALVSGTDGRPLLLELLDIAEDVAMPPGRYPASAVPCKDGEECADFATPLTVRYLPADPAVAMSEATYREDLADTAIAAIATGMGLGFAALVVILAVMWRRMNEPNAPLWPPDSEPTT